MQKNRVPATRNHRPTQPLVDNLYQGMTLDAVTGLYHERNRDYSPSLGRWMEQDPAQYINGANTYQFVDSSPVGNVDASGFFWDGGFHGWWALLYAVPFVGWAWGAGHAMGEGVVALQNLGNDAEAAQRGQLRLVNQAANPNAPAPAQRLLPSDAQDDQASRTHGGQAGQGLRYDLGRTIADSRCYNGDKCRQGGCGRYRRCNKELSEGWRHGQTVRLPVELP